MKSSRYNIYHEDGDITFAANTMTGSCVLLDRKELQKLRKEDYSSFSESDLKELEKQGLIVEDWIDEVNLLRYAYNNSRYNLKSSVLTIAPTLECNFRCTYCYERSHRGVMDDSTQVAVIEFIKKLIAGRSIKNLHVSWYGGEPLLYPEIIERISGETIKLCDAHRVNYTSSIITNGYLMTPKVQEVLKKARVSKIQITLDGDKESHNKKRVLRGGQGTYDKVMEGIKSLSGTDFKVSVRVNIDKDNIHKYDYVKKRFEGCSNISCYPAKITVEETESSAQKNACFKCGEFDEFYARIPLEGRLSIVPSIPICTADQPDSYVISPMGNLMKCFNDVCDQSMAVGHISNPEFAGAKAISFYMGRDPFSEPECKDCPYIPQCYGGCANEYRKNGVHSCMEVKYLFLRKCMANIKYNFPKQ